MQSNLKFQREYVVNANYVLRAWLAQQMPYIFIVLVPICVIYILPNFNCRMHRVNDKSTLQKTSAILSTVKFMALPTLRLTANVVNPKPLLPEFPCARTGHFALLRQPRATPPAPKSLDQNLTYT